MHISLSLSIYIYIHRHNAHVYIYILDNSMNLVDTIVEFCNILDWFLDAFGCALHRHLTHAQETSGAPTDSGDFEFISSQYSEDLKEPGPRRL